MPKIKVKGQKVQAGECPQANKWADGRTDRQTDATKRIISLASRSIIKKRLTSCVQPVETPMITDTDKEIGMALVSIFGCVFQTETAKHIISLLHS